MLEVKNISSGYGKKKVLYDVSLKVATNDIALLTGGNGSGKSTLLKCIYNILPCWSGEIFFEGEKINGLKSSDLIHKGIVYIPQKDFYFENLSVIENLQVSGSIYKKKKKKSKLENVLQMIPLLGKIMNRNTFNLSGGEKKILSIGIGLMHDPKLILFDEPFSGLDHSKQGSINTLINQLNDKQKISLLIVEHKSSNIHYQNIVQL